MGKEQNGLAETLEEWPTIRDYLGYRSAKKKDVDEFISDAIKANGLLRINGKEVRPKKDDLWMLEWGDLIQLRQLINEKDMQGVFALMFQVKERQFLKLELFNCFAVYKWILEQVEGIEKIEKQELGDDPTQDEKNAGVEELEKFGAMASVDNLAMGNVLDYDKVLKKPYAVIFQKMCLDKVKGDIQKRFTENANRKARANSRRKRF